MRTVTARYVFPVAGPPLAGGLLTFDGDRIVAVEPAGTRPPDEDFGNAAILPGLVNAHTHLDLSGARGLIPPTDPDHFTDWLRGVIAYRRGRTAEQVQQDIRDGLNEVLRCGTTLVGDITSGGASWDAVSNADLRGAIFWEIIGLTFRRSQDAYFSAFAWLEDHANTILCRTAISPHSTYTVRKWLFSGAVEGMSRAIRPFAIHLAESMVENELLVNRQGTLKAFLEEVGAYDAEGLIDSFSECLNRSKGTHPQVYIHCNYLPADTPFLPNQSIVYCPRTHAAFGHPSHPFREFLARGVRVCLGTDSLASNPDLDILAEARFVRSRYPDFPGDQLLKMITLSGAEALGWADECGSLEVGKSADFVVVPLPNRDEADPYDLFLKDDSAPASRRTMFRGEWRNQ
jgi:cytosine/adenosine deaminase-related metal-dependent hydrolase